MSVSCPFCKNSWTDPICIHLDADATALGYKTTLPRTLRWGTNEITDFGTFAGANTLVTNFSLGASQTDFEGQGVKNDSGGAFFVETTPGVWKVAGLIVAVSTFPGQPGGTETAVFGRQTVAIDLSDHKTEIMALVPEPATSALLLGVIVAVLSGLRKRPVVWRA